MEDERLKDFPEKTAPVGADIVYLGDSADNFLEKKSTIENTISNAYPALASIAALTTTADRMLYTTGSNVYAVTPLTSFARSFLDDASGAAVCGTIGALQAAQNLADLNSAAIARKNIAVATFIEVAITHTDLATGGSKVLVDSQGSEQYKIRNMWISNVTLTSFSGGGGDRDLDVQVVGGATIWTTIAASLLQTLLPVRWGDTDFPIKTSSDEPSAAGVDIVAKYSGGTTDYAAGEIKLIIEVERIV